MKKFIAFLLMIIISLNSVGTVYAADVPNKETPNYKVAFFPYDCFNMQDEDGERSGYGYEMMQTIANYLQCTFSYVGYDKSAAECVEMLRNGELDIYTAAKRTTEREEEFIFSRHPSITAMTCMTVKVGNTKVVAGDYDTYNGLRIGLLERYTYNGKFEEFAKSKGFSYALLYYDTPEELTNALITGEVDALVNSYISTPEDERVVEELEQTPYYLMARKENQALMDEIDYAIDIMNVDRPTWRADLFNQYYGISSKSTDYTEEEQSFLDAMRMSQTVVRAVMNPEQTPYSWYEDGEPKGIAVDVFKEVVSRLGLDYEILPVSSKEEYEDAITEGAVDIWMDVDGCYEDEREGKYKLTSSYLKTTASMLYKTGDSGRTQKIAITDESIPIRKIIAGAWPDAEVIVADSLEKCVQLVLDGGVDGALLMTYTAQRMVQDDARNRLRAEIVPRAFLELRMGVSAQDNVLFYGLWEKTLSVVAEQSGTDDVQKYLERTVTPSVGRYLYTHPSILIMIIISFFLAGFFIVLYFMQVQSWRKQQKISEELAVALHEAEEANESKQNFFSKMSHDIRTPLNVVLGMTQVAQKYQKDSLKLENALDSIQSEGSYLLMLINSILDVNQLEYGHIELLQKPFSLKSCLVNSVNILRPLADKKAQKISIHCEMENCVVIGDTNRLSQIIINILSNAIKYTPGGGQIDISMDCVSENRYRFRCTDNGIGMTEEFIEHICEDYSRAEDSRISKTEGTGLGMSVVKGFTELMHGSLSIESEPGKGSTFVVEVPLPSASDEQREQVLHPKQDGDRNEAEYMGKRALLVEDNALNAEIAIELLQSIGFTVEWAENGKISVDKFEASEAGYYFAIFMDMQMPVMDGLEATRRIRESQKEDSDIPIFAMTANTFASDRRKCREAGMTGYISKPISMRAIETVLKENAR